MRSLLFRACITLALVLSLGLHWTVLQSAAWVGMVLSYSKDSGLGEALGKTFDGAHPCQLCKIVESGTKGEKENDRQAQTTEVKKLDLMLAAVAALVVPAPDAQEYSPLMQRPVSREYDPPVPPPRKA